VLLEQILIAENLLGRSESATAFMAIPEIDPDDRENIGKSFASIGRPISNSKVYVVNSKLQLAPVGGVGELCISGAGLAAGYLNHPDLTCEKFVKNPYSADSGHILYRTGDLVRWRSDGNLEYLGRMDEQLKVRGFRIEPGEIEAALGEIEGIRESVVVARDMGDEERQLIAYIVPSASEKDRQSVDKLRLLLSRKLPAYMIPSYFVYVSGFALTASGKVDKKMLPTPDDNQFCKETYKEPRSESERQLCELWASLLRVERVGIDDNFFSLGGHSLLAARLISAVRNDFAVDIPLRLIFDRPTVSELSEEILIYKTKREFDMQERVLDFSGAEIENGTF
jgi:acyl carrier protein